MNEDYPADQPDLSAAAAVPPPVSPEDVPGGKLFSAGQITLATFLGAPLAGCLLLVKNFRALGKGGAAWQPLVVGIASTTLLIILGFILPEKFPGAGLAAGGCFGIYYYAKQVQGGVIENHLKAGGRQGSWLSAIAVGVVCAVVLFALIVALAITFDLGPPLDEQAMPIAKIRVSRAGQIEPNGNQVNREQLRAALADLKDDGEGCGTTGRGWTSPRPKRRNR